MNDQTAVAKLEEPIEAERPPFVPGVFSDMPAATYHAIEALSSSGSKKMIRSPMHYKLMRDTPAEPTEQMQFGTCVHDGVLEPHAFASRVALVPADAPKRPTKAQYNAKKPSPETLDAIAYWRDLDAAHAGKITLSAPEFDRCRRCVDAVLAHPAARALLDGGIIEQSLFWVDARYGVPCKSRIDIRNHGGIADLKTTQDASPEAFARSAANLLYHVQAAFNNSGHEHLLDSSMKFFVFIAVESEPPHAVACYSLRGDAVRAGAYLCNIAAERYARALKTGKWSGYPDTIEEMKFPRYALVLNE